MSKSVLKNLVWLALPLGLAVGCAESRPTSQAYYQPLPAQLTPTSSEPEQQIYVTPNGPGQTAADSMNTPPAGTSPATWALAQEIQKKLLTDPALAPLGNTLIAQVSADGTVTLRGNASTRSEQKRVRDSISALPGVRSVKDETTLGHFNGPSTINTEQ